MRPICPSNEGENDKKNAPGSDRRGPRLRREDSVLAAGDGAAGRGDDGRVEPRVAGAAALDRARERRLIAQDDTAESGDARGTEELTWKAAFLGHDQLAEGVDRVLRRAETCHVKSPAPKNAAAPPRKA